MMIPVAVGKEMMIGEGAFERSSVAWTDDGRIVVAADMGEKPELWFGEEPVRNGLIVMKVLVDGMEKNPIYANRCFLPKVVVDCAGGVWVSFKTGTKELDQKHRPGTTRGVALAAVYDGEDPEVVLALRDVGHGQAQAVPGRRGVVVLGTAGRWAQFDETLRKANEGGFPAGDSGEKVQFRISPSLKKSGAAVWHTCHNGCKEQASRYARTGLAQPLTWAEHAAYPDQGKDLNHPGLGVDAKKRLRAFMGAVLQGALRINLVDKASLKFPANRLPALHAATLENRHGPQFIPHPAGGMLCLFNYGGKVMCLDVEAAVADPAGVKAQVLASGRFASGAIRGSTMAVVFARDGRLWKREFRVE
jgi:hypothetical protein